MIRTVVLRALQRARRAAPHTGMALVAGLAAPLADGAPGDLDPTFGDAGRLVLVDAGQAWSLELEEEGDGFLAGGSYYCSYFFYTCDADSFTRPFSSAGVLDLDYTHPDLPGTLIQDTVRQPDGKLIGVGRTVQGRSSLQPISSLTVFRLLPDGSLDATFGEAGVVQISGASRITGTAVVLDPDGRIVVAGSRGSLLLVARLLDDGTLDADFGDAGLVFGPENVREASLVRVADGGYRVSTSTFTGDDGVPTCRIVALTADGTLDASFGTGGTVDVAPEAGGVYCADLALQPDGRLVVAGTAGNDPRGLVVRLVADGSPDDTFSAPAISEAMTQAAAVTFDADGRVLVAGKGPFDMAGAMIARLGVDGALDTTYGNAGTTWVDVPSPQAQFAFISDMATGADGSLTVAGNSNDGPFAARLSGDGSADAAGIISMSRPVVPATEGGGPAIVTVRRAGGKSGAVHITYRTTPIDGSPAASPGADYEEVTGELTWADGDATEREIPVTVAADGSEPEGFEHFLLTIDSSEGAAGLGGQATLVQIAADGAPAGQFLVHVFEGLVREGETIAVQVERAYYGTGEVSVSLELSGTATDDTDYQVQPTVLTWVDGEQGAKEVIISALTDDIDETPAETVTLTLTNPSGGAILGASASGTVQITNVAPTQGGNNGGSSGGGGAFGWASLLALCTAGSRRFRSKLQRRFASTREPV